MAGVAALSEDVDGSPITYHFCYQATSSFDITLNWSFTSTPTSPAMTITYQELGGSPVASSATTPGTTGTHTVNLPASTFCYVLIEAEGDGGTLTTSLS
jgi:hypothetical protein